MESVDHEAGVSPQTTPGGRAPELLLSADEVSVVGGDAGGGGFLEPIVNICR